MTRVLTVRGLWVLGIRRLEAGPELLVAEVGRHSGVRVVPAPPGSPVADALDVDADDLAAPGADETIAGAAWAETSEGDAWRIPGPSGLRPLLLAASLSPLAFGARALEGPSGARLARLCALGDLGSLLGTFETLNVLPNPAAAAARCRSRHVVVLGEAALAALALEAGVARGDARRFGVVDPRSVDLESLRSALGAASLRTADHPSGRSLRLNPEPARVAASATLLSAALAARGLPHLAGPLELAAARAAEWASEGPGRHHRVRGDADDVRHMRAAWCCAQACGVAWPGSAPGAGWTAEVGQLPRLLLRRVHGGLLTVEGPPYRAAVEVGGVRRERDVSDEAGALLWAEHQARLLGALTPWEMRDAELAAEGRRDLEGIEGLHRIAEVSP